MVALGVELFPRQVGQTVDIVEVVEAVPVLLKGKAARAGFLQRGPLGLRDAHQGEGHAVGGGVLGQGVHGGGQGAAPGGVEVAQTQLSLNPHQQAAAAPGDLLGPRPAPQVDAGEAVLAGGVGLGGQQGLDPLAVLKLGTFKGEHTIHSFSWRTNMIMLHKKLFSPPYKRKPHISRQNWYT